MQLYVCTCKSCYDCHGCLGCTTNNIILGSNFKLAMKKVLNHLEIGDGDLLDLIDNSTANKVA